MSWKARLMTGLMLVAMLMAIAGPAMADHTQRHENRQDRWEDRWDEHWDEVEFEVEEFEVDDFSWFWSVPVVLVIEDVDCDGIEDHLDHWIEDCEVDVEVVELWNWWH